MLQILEQNEQIKRPPQQVKAEKNEDCDPGCSYEEIQKALSETDVLDKELASIKPQVSKKIPVTHSDIGSTRNSAQDDRAFYQEVNKILQQKKLSKNIRMDLEDRCWVL